MSVVRRCLGCSATYPAQEHSCPKCGSHAADVEEPKAPPASSSKPKPPRRPRKS